MSYGRDASASVVGGSGCGDPCQFNGLSKTSRSLTNSVLSFRRNAPLSMLSHESRAFASPGPPNCVSVKAVVKRAPRCRSARHTFSKTRDVAMRCRINQTAFPPNADCSQDIVASAHDCANVRLVKLLQNPSRGSLQFVLKNDKANEVQARFDLISFHLLNLHPVELRDVSSSTADDTVAFVCIIRELFVVILWDYESSGVSC